MLLSLVPLAILSVVKDDHDTPIPVSNSPLRSSPHGHEGNNFASRRHGLISSLKTLGQFSALLSPPPSVVNAANNAATKAAIFVSNFKAGNNNQNVGRNDTSIKAGMFALKKNFKMLSYELQELMSHHRNKFWIYLLAFV